MRTSESRRPGYRGLSAVALAGALALAAGCGSDQAVRGDRPVPVPSDVHCFDGNISGAGSSAQENSMKTWVAGFQTACDDAQVFYDSIGSGGGRSQFIDDAVDFAGSDAPMDDEETSEAAPRCEGTEPINIPGYVVPIAVVFNLKGVDSLNLRPATIAEIFDRKITHWDDSAIARDNPDADLPHTRITPVSRSDESGTTENFTAYLKAAASDSWPHGTSGQWPGTPAEAAQGNSGVAEAVEGGTGTIGYVENSHVGDMHTAKVGVGDGFEGISPKAAASVVESSPERKGGGRHDHALELDYGTATKGTYPIVLVSYEIVCPRYPRPDQAERVRAFLRYVISDEGQQAAAEETGSAPLPSGMRDELLQSIGAITAA